MKTLRGTIVAAALVVALSAVHASALETYIALLNSGQETPPNTSTAFGIAFMTFDSANDMLCHSITFTGLSTTEVAAHFHGPAAPGVAAGILFPLPLGNPKNGCVGPLDGTTHRQLKTGLLYINIHSANFPAGEIRGQVERTS